MANLNKVLLIGRLTRDPEMRSTSSGSSVTSFGLAVNRTYTRRDSNDRVEETCFVDVEAWGRTGETIHRYMRKGRQIFLEGRLKLDTWERDGQKHSRMRVVVENFQFLDSQNGGGGGSDDYARPAPANVGSRQGSGQGPASGPDDFGGGRSGGGGGGGGGGEMDDIPF